jgi:3-deoxy-7-phosphoheptulonate synthase
MNTLQSNSITQNDIDDVNLQSIHPLVTPAELKTELPLTESAYQTVLHGRETIRNILDGMVNEIVFINEGKILVHQSVEDL